MRSVERILKSIRINNILVLMFFPITLGTIYLSIFLNKRLEDSISEIKSNQRDFIMYNDSVIATNDSLTRLADENSRQIIRLKEELGTQRFEEIIDQNKKP